MTRELLLEMALKVAVDIIQRRSEKSNSYPPVLSPLQSIVSKVQTERDIELIKYYFEHSVPVPNQEQKDLVLLHEAQKKEYETFSSLVIHYLRMEPDQLRHCGSKTKKRAIFKSAEAHKKLLERLVKAHIKKYPD